MTGKSEEVENKAEETVDSAQALAEAQAQADKYLDMARRLQADFDNFRKRTQRENEEFRKYACSSIIGDLLTVVDDLDRALEHAGEETEFVKGIRGVRANLMKVLESNGVRSRVPRGPVHRGRGRGRSRRRGLPEGIHTQRESVEIFESKSHKEESRDRR